MYLAVMKLKLHVEWFYCLILCYVLLCCIVVIPPFAVHTGVSPTAVPPGFHEQPTTKTNATTKTSTKTGSATEASNTTTIIKTLG